MIFTSIEYLLFFVAVVFAFFAIPHRFRWMFLLAVSYFYYMTLDPRYAILILTTTIIVYGTALVMHNRSVRVKKLCVAFSVISNLSILFMFKYYNFFNNSLRDLFNALGMGYHVPQLSLLLPIGISFYTFQALSYTIDVYRGTREPVRNFGMFALFVSFFPVILSGPIERSTTLLPQFYKKAEFSYERVTDGLKLMAWGFFQKLVIADRLNVYVSMVYGQPQLFKGLPLMAATYFFVFQVYCDFSGYTDIAIGSAQVMGYDLIPNFRRPYFAQSIAELWRRWHMSLITWFRDYLYIPLGGNRVHRFRLYLNILIVFTLSGLWHGAQWTFVTWGSLNGVLIVLSRITQKARDWIRGTIFGGLARVPASAYFVLCAALTAVAAIGGASGFASTGGRIAAGAGGLAVLALGILRTRGEAYGRFIGKMQKFWMVFVTFHLFTLGAIFFRSKSLTDAWYVITHFLGKNIAHVLLFFKIDDLLMMIGVILLLNVIHLIQERGSIRQMLKSKPLVVRWALYYLMVMGIFMGIQKTAQFIYFSF